MYYVGIRAMLGCLVPYSAKFSRRTIFMVLANCPEQRKLSATNFYFGRCGHSKTSSIHKNCFHKMLEITQSAKNGCLKNLALYGIYMYLCLQGYVACEDKYSLGVALYIPGYTCTRVCYSPRVALYHECTYSNV